MTGFKLDFIIDKLKNNELSIKSTAFINEKY